MGHHSSPCAELLVGQLLVANVGPGNCGRVGERRAQRQFQHFCMPQDPCGEAAQAGKCAQQDTLTCAVRRIESHANTMVEPKPRALSGHGEHPSAGVHV